MVEIASAADAEFERSVFEERMAVAANDRGRTVSPLPDSSLLRSPRSPDTASPIYPERAIRPLPKSRLKSRLSPEQASHIVYPPDLPPIASPLLSNAAEPETAPPARRVNGARGAPVQAYASHVHSHHHHHEDALHYPADEGRCTCGHDREDALDSGDEEIEFDHPDYRYPPPLINGTPTPAGQPGHVNKQVLAHALANGKTPLDGIQRRLVEVARRSGKLPPHAPASTASSADGYESFENTSNKKKRKIPLSSASSTLNHSSLSAEMASMGISGQNDGAGDDGGPLAVQGQPYTPLAVGAGAAGTGISGAGRGRYGRNGNPPRNGLRRPLGTGTANLPNGYAAAQKGVPRSAAAGVRPVAGTDNYENTGGIISQAIKSAAEQGPLPPQKANSTDKTSSKESLLQSATSPSSNTAPKTQFTFHCDSESATKMVNHEEAAIAAHQQAAYATTTPTMPGSYPTNGPGAGGVPLPARGQNGQNGAAQRVSTQGMQTTPSLRGGPQANVAGRPPLPPASGAPLPAGTQQQAAPPAPAPAPKPKPRRRPSKEYALAARQRQLHQEYQNYHHPPSKDKLWICEFCEYEDIFGVPPVALIRSYEIKDRQERKKADEKRRLLEKAKMKGRNKKGKGKKGAANNANNAAAAGNATAPAVNGVGNYDPNLPPPDGEEYYDDEEYGDEYEPVGAEGEYDDPYYAPPPPAPAGTPLQTPGVGTGGPLAPPPDARARA